MDRGGGSSATGMFSPGAVIAGRYEVKSRIGSGGMGTVLAAIDRSLDNEPCALKLLHPQLARDETILARFRNEVILARKITHTHIARIYDFGDTGQGYFYISMEYIPGSSLGALLLSKGPDAIPFSHKLRILAEVAEGIGFAHDQGVVHRDLKPDNILLTEKGMVKITDFGLARSLTDPKGLTKTGEAVGTPCYMAPEQLRGDAVDGRCDIYAFGIIAFELLTGKKPFYDENYFTLATMHIKDPLPRIQSKTDKIPSWLEALVQKATAKRPNDRFAKAQEIAAIFRKHLGA